MSDSPFLTALGFLALVLAGCTHPSENGQGQPPSMVWLICEDQSVFFPQYGDSTVSLPHLASLADQGTVFQHMFSVSPVCAPSRSSLLTGILPTQMGTHHMRAYRDREGLNPHTGLPFYSAPMPDGVRAFTELLREAGVHCTNRGKEDYNFETPPGAWDESSRTAHWRSRPEGAPFFAVFNLFGSHESRIWERNNPRNMPSADRISVPPILPDLPEVRQDMAVNYANLMLIDSLVGTIIRELKEDGLYDQTTILFTSDHGGPFPGFKRSASDPGLRVPLVVKWANGARHSVRNDGLFSFLDLAPTALNHFRLPIPEALPGIPLTPESDGHPAVFGAADRFDMDLTRQRTVRTKQWRLTRNHLLNPSLRLNIPYRRQMATMQAIDSLAETGVEPWNTWATEPAPELELYDLSTDPWQLVNLADQPEHAARADSLDALLEGVFSPDLDWGWVSEAGMLAEFDALHVLNARP